MLVPCLLLAGLLLGSFKLQEFAPDQKPCALGQCPLILHASDSRHTFIYSVGARFDVVLDETKGKKGDATCMPAGVVRLRQDAPGEEAISGAYFEAIAPGACTLYGNNFSATIVVR